MSSRVAVRASRLGGKGIFALREFAPGERVCDFRLVREVTKDAPLRSEDGESAHHCTFVGDRLFLVGAPERYLNHSCDPNVYTKFDEGRVSIVAMKPIGSDDELVTDYLINNAGGDSWACDCGAARCRGETGHSFFTLPEAFRTEYAAYLAPWFVERHADRLTDIGVS